MVVVLPTDTQHLGVETRQYELFNHPLGQGIPRRTIGIGAVVCAAWWLVLVVVGADPVSRLGPMLFLVPPFTLVYLGTRVGDDGRMRLLAWYAAVLARAPARRRVIRNPLLPAAAGYQVVPLRPRVVTLLCPAGVCLPVANGGAPNSGAGDGS